MPNDRKFWRSPLGNLIAGLLWIVVAPFVVYGIGGASAAYVSVGIGTLLILVAVGRWTFRRTGGGTALLVVMVLTALALPVAAKANPADGCDNNGCAKFGDPVPWVENWSPYMSSDPDHLPPAGCRTLTGSSIGKYPSVVVSLVPFKVRLKTSYVFGAQLKFCWVADWVSDSATGRILQVDHRKIVSWHVKPLGWGPIDRGIVKNPHILSVKAVWDSPDHTCMTVTATGAAEVSVPPIPHLTPVDLMTYPRVEFHDLCNDGSVLGIYHDYFPF